MKTKLMSHYTLGFILMAGLGSAQAQSGGTFNLGWHTLNSAGGLSSGGNFGLDGTVGQPEASPASVGGGYALTGGFWTGDTEVGPPLFIARSGPNIVISWT